jgi:hypothetical protein
METLTWQLFKDQLKASHNLALQFQYATDQFVHASYHITEIKQATVTSVDCGGVMNAWTEVIVQLWEPAHEQTSETMKVSKAWSIIELVEKTLPLNPNGIVKIEFGNAKFDTRQMLPAAITIDGGNLIVDLRADTVQCKAIERGGSCGTDANGDECCAPVAKPQLPLINLAANNAFSCTPGSGCC